MKRKTMTLVLCLLAALALVSVGFASWVISAGTSETTEGTITVDDVVDKRLQITKPQWAKGNTFYFGGPTAEQKKQVTKTAWLTNDDAEEKLTLSFTFTVSFKGTTYTKGDAVVTGSIAEQGEANLYGIAKNEGYVGELPEVVITEGEDGLFTATITFTWGEKFDNTNPYVYYNNNKTESDAQTAIDSLNALQALNAAKFTITLTVTPKAN